MSLFSNDPVNVLPCDGEAIYYGRIMDTAAADSYRNVLLNTIAWRNDEAVVFGKRIITSRKVAWYGDEGFSYSYSNTTKQALPWTDELLTLKKLAEAITGATYNSCLLNLYHNGDEGVSWHSDGEKALLHHGAIASLSFGAERKFSFKHKTTADTVSVLLENGSLLLMKGATQTNWLHSLPKSKKIISPRVNLTFRTIVK